MFLSFSLRKKIFFCVFPLVFALCGIGFILINKNYQTWKQAEQIELSSDYFVAISHLIHELQKERGRTSAFVNGKGTFEEVDRQRKLVDQAIHHLQPILLRIESYLSESTRTIFSEYSQLRQDIDQKGKLADPLPRFGELIRKLIFLQVKRASNHSLNGLEGKLISQSLIEMAKESMGRFRASMNVILASDLPASHKDLNLLENYLAGVTVNLQSPGLTITEDTKLRIEKTISSKEWQEIQRIWEKVKLKSLEGHYGENQSAFFSTITQVMDSVSEIIGYEAEKISALAMISSKGAHRDFWFVVVLMSVGITVIVAFVVGLVSEIVNQLSELAQELSQGAQHSASSSQELSVSSTTLSSGVTEQAAALQETVASLEEVNAMVSKNSESAEKLKKIASSNVQEAQHGQGAVAEMRTAIAAIYDGTQAISQQIDSSNIELNKITEIINRISEKTKVIHEIVFQTKLLSFNASVEAARAGEQGKGFAIVAEEIGNLAQMSGSAAQEIAGLLADSVQTVETIVTHSKTKIANFVDQAKIQVETGTNKTQGCQTVLDSLLSTTNEIAQRVKEIAEASFEQAQGVGQISTAMNQLDAVTQANSSSSTQVANVARQVNQQAQDLEGVVAKLNGLVFGHH
jgi:methyl-accepting chemotaxis protein